MKVLIISHTSLNTHNNMGKTLLSLFAGFEKEELCQLYIYPMIPDVDKCESYYRITDKDVLKSYFRFFKVRGKEISPEQVANAEHVLFEDSSDEKFYRNKKNKTALRILLRDLMWKMARWYNKDLRNWIQQQKPTCIFLAPGMPKLIYDVALKISEDYGLPMVVYICDDFYFTNTPSKNTPLLKRIQQNLLEKKTKQLFAKSEHIITICDELADCYSEEFSLPTTKIMTGSNYPIADKIMETPQIEKLTYMGNIRYNRYLCLADIGRVLDEINKDENKQYCLEIYSIEKEPEILASFAGIDSIKFSGFVSGREFDNVFHSAELFIHTEAFDEFNIDLTKRSVSTKIADCLGSGVPLFAYGPDCIASMHHLISTHSAVIATKPEQLKEILKQCLDNVNIRNTVAENGICTARKFHSAEKQSEKLIDVLKNVQKIDIL